MLVLVLCRCVNTTKVKMEAARLVEEDGGEVDASVGCKAASLQLSPSRIVCRC